MFTDLSLAKDEYFFKRPCVVGGVPCVLIEPHGVGVAKWDKTNLIFRSSIWTLEGELVSPGFPKFFNWDEDLDKDGRFVPGKVPYGKPRDLSSCEILDKMDGSLLIISYFNGDLIVRTRGTIDADATLSNGDEIPLLKKKYPALFAYVEQHPDITLLCEWYSPRNKIVLNYGEEPKLWLIGGIMHENYSLVRQVTLDVLAGLFGMERPARYQFNTLEAMRATVEALEGKEGVCVYFNDGQNILKLKSARYLALHYYKGDVSTFDKIVDIWLSIGKPGYQAFYDFLAQKYDWEIAEYARPMLSKICDASKRVDDVLNGMKNFINTQLAGLSRKEQFAKASSSYGNTPRLSMVMKLLDSKPLNNEQIKKLVLQFI